MYKVLRLFFLALDGGHGGLVPISERCSENKAWMNTHTHTLITLLFSCSLKINKHLWMRTFSVEIILFRCCKNSQLLFFILLLEIADFATNNETLHCQWKSIRLCCFPRCLSDVCCACYLISSSRSSRRPDPSLVVFRFVLSFVFHIGHQPFCFQPARLCVSAVRFSYDL